MTHQAFIKKLVIIKIFLFCFAFSQSTNKEYIDQTKYNDMLADKFFNDKKYQLAIIEYERLLFNSFDESLIKKYRTKVAESYAITGQKLEAINEYKKLLLIDKSHYPSVLEISTLYQDIYYFYESNQFIMEKISFFDNQQADTLRYLLSVNYFALNEKEKSLKILNELSSFDEVGIAKENIYHYYNSLGYSPSKASLMNLLFPGSGYAYLKMPQTALATLFTLSLFAYATDNSIENSNSFGSIFGGILFSGFYIGSIYGANQNALKKRNLKLESSVFKMRKLLLSK
mgnify:CR=1 FL=1